MENNLVPLFDQLRKHSEMENISFHVPGHKNGDVFLFAANSVFSSILKIDSTELTGLDDLHGPVGVIKEAEELTAELYRAKKSFFLVGGSTAGNLAMVLATCNDGDTVLVQRNSHKSIMNGCRLARVNPVFLTPNIDIDSGLFTGVSYDTVKEVIEKYRNAKAIVLTYPSYYGMAKDIQSIIELAHSYHIPVLVDEAHGAHFTIGEPFPPSALDLGADVVVQSAHKTLPAMTMASFLHIGRNSIIDEQKVQQYLQMIQSSSPSYPLMASLDLARSYLAQLDSSKIAAIIKDIERFRERLNEIEQWKVITTSDHHLKIDPLKITLQSTCHATGIELQQRLEQKGIFVELADEDHLLLVMPLAPFERQEEVIQLMKDAVKDIPLVNKPLRQQLTFPPYTRLELSYQEMKKYNRKKVRLEEAIGYIAGEALIPYPPGIPFLMEGERVQLDTINKLLEMERQGIRFQGIESLHSRGIYILEE